MKNKGLSRLSKYDSLVKIVVLTLIWILMNGKLESW